MPDFSVIKNEKLRNLVKASRKFQGLSAFQQEKRLTSMQNLTPDQEEQLCQFFTAENAKENKEMSSEEKLEILNRLYAEVVEMEEKFTRLLKQENETKQRSQDDDSMNNLLSSLNK